MKALSQDNSSHMSNPSRTTNGEVISGGERMEERVMGRTTEAKESKATQRKEYEMEKV